MVLWLLGHIKYLQCARIRPPFIVFQNMFTINYIKLFVVKYVTILCKHSAILFFSTCFELIYYTSRLVISLMFVDCESPFNYANFKNLSLLLIYITPPPPSTLFKTRPERNMAVEWC